MKAFVDGREPDSIKEKINGRYEVSGIAYESKELPQADFYLPEHDVAVERKEASDFASSTTDGRLSEQADRMVAEHDHVFVIIERPYDPLYDLAYSNISDNSIVGMQTSLAVKRGIKIIYTESMEQTVYAVNRIFERFVDEEHERAESGYVKTADTGEVDDVQAAMIAQVRGISNEKAKEISELFAIHEFVNHPEDIKEELAEMVDGVGDTLAGRIVEAFQ